MENGFVERPLDIRIDGRFQLCRHLGAGSFGVVYLGRDVQTNNEVAIKLEHHYDVELSLLDQEIDIYKSLRGRTGFPQVFWHGDEGDYRAMVFELLGPNLEDLLRYCGGRFSTKTTLMLMDQLLRRLECLHTTGYIHRDIKPENFLLGTGKQGHVVCATDMGLAAYRRVWDEGIKSHCPTKTTRPSLIGTCRYASISGHLGLASSCRDDLESLGYMVVYFLRGSLPWQGLRGLNRREKDKRVLEQKQQIDVEELCKDLPVEFATYMNYLRQTRDPNSLDYVYLRNLFRGLFRRLGYEHDHVFDWTIREFERLNLPGRAVPGGRSGETRANRSNI